MTSVLGGLAPAAFLREHWQKRPLLVRQALPGFAVDPWLGLFMPAKVPAEIINRVNAEVRRILNGAELKARLAPQGIELVTNSPAEFARFIRADQVKWAKLMKQAGINP